MKTTLKRIVTTRHVIIAMVVLVFLMCVFPPTVEQEYRRSRRVPQGHYYQVTGHGCILNLGGASVAVGALFVQFLIVGILGGGALWGIRVRERRSKAQVENSKSESQNPSAPGSG